MPNQGKNWVLDVISSDLYKKFYLIFYIINGIGFINSPNPLSTKPHPQKRLPQASWLKSDLQHEKGKRTIGFSGGPLCVEPLIQQDPDFVIYRFSTEM
jgi:hypothetical protein